MNTAEIRRGFVSYYEDLGYQLLPSAPMIDPSIPMSFVMSAGLVQVENSIARSQKREGNQYVLVQNCFRHFDLEKVGTDDTHLSLFEMPGAFVFGADVKNKTIHRMWKLATEVLRIDRRNIWVSYFQGGDVRGIQVAEDTMTLRTWLEIGISEDHVVGLGTDNNFWMQRKGIEQAGTPPKCGPNTELFYDRGVEWSCSPDCRPSCKCGRFIEFSNSLFICAEIEEKEGCIRPIQNPFTETVIGAERVSMICQNTRSVFEIDEFTSLVQCVQSLVKTNNLPSSDVIASQRVIADHIRGLFYLVAGGAPPPGKNGRERIMKMLIRRVITRLIVLNIDVETSIPVLVASISNSQVEVHNFQVSNLLIEYFHLEYQRFKETIGRGQRQLNQILKENHGNVLSGQQILELEKKWGLPSLLTELMIHQYRPGSDSSMYQGFRTTHQPEISDRIN